MTTTTHWHLPLHKACQDLHRAVKKKGGKGPLPITLHVRLCKEFCSANDLKAGAIMLPHPRSELRLLVDRRLKVTSIPAGYVVTYADQLDMLQRFGTLTPPLRATDRYRQNKRKRLTRWIGTFDILLCRVDFIPSHELELFQELTTAKGRVYRTASVIDDKVVQWLQLYRRRTFLTPSFTLCRRTVTVVVEANKDPTVLHHLRRQNTMHPTLQLRHTILAEPRPEDTRAQWLQRELCIKFRKHHAKRYADVLVFYDKHQNLTARTQWQKVIRDLKLPTKLIFCDCSTEKAQTQSLLPLREIVRHLAMQSTSCQYRPHITTTLGTASLSTKKLVDQALVVIASVYDQLTQLGWSKKLTMRLSAPRLGSFNITL